MRLRSLGFFFLAMLLHFQASAWEFIERNRSNWYGVVGTGYAFSMKAGINPDPAYWDFANEGYDANLSSNSFIFVGVGKKLYGCFDLDFTYSFYQPFHYQKYQTGTSSTPGFTGGARVRFFDLFHQNAMVTASLDPKWSSLCYDLCGLRINPLLGIGIGVGVNQVDHFYTVASDTATATYGDTTSIGKCIRTASFAWQAVGSLRFQFPFSPLSADVGYRYYNGGQFEGPSKVVINTPALPGVIEYGTPWKGFLKANEVYIDLILTF